ncbi:PASTA domain-containing protein, partial [Pseudonocardia abyssalis]
EPAATAWVMPDLVGANLQDAQNAIQSLTGFGIAITTSTDATGAGRNQVLDANWTVCAQNIAPGETITPDSGIDFAAVKLEESC